MLIKATSFIFGGVYIKRDGVVSRDLTVSITWQSIKEKGNTGVGDGGWIPEKKFCSRLILQDFSN